jgi:hypothetical protein
MSTDECTVSQVLLMVEQGLSSTISEYDRFAQKQQKIVTSKLYLPLSTALDCVMDNFRRLRREVSDLRSRLHDYLDTVSLI